MFFTTYELHNWLIKKLKLTNSKCTLTLLSLDLFIQKLFIEFSTLFFLTGEIPHTVWLVVCKTNAENINICVENTECSYWLKNWGLRVYMKTCRMQRTHSKCDVYDYLVENCAALVLDVGFMGGGNVRRCAVYEHDVDGKRNGLVVRMALAHR